MEESDNYDAHDDAEYQPLMVWVTAPATLPAGYTFGALLNDNPDRPFTCEVPEGGVTEGESFMIPLPKTFGGEHISAPTGRWKDGLFACCNYGVFHPHFWCAFFCSKISMAQIMTRMSLTWLGQPGPYVSTKNTFKVVMILLVSYICYSLSLDVASLDYTADTMPPFIVVMKAIGGSLWFIWSLYSVCRTRQSVRAQYSIPEEHCVGCEDVCCSLWCTSCTLAQMARHTGEYETYPGAWCSTTGHPAGTPLTV